MSIGKKAVENIITSNYATKFMGFLNNPEGMRRGGLCMPLPRSAWYGENCSECVYDFADNRMHGWLGNRSEEINKICEIVDRAYNDYSTRFYACTTWIPKLTLPEMRHQIFKMSALMGIGLGALTLSAINYRLIRRDAQKKDLKKDLEKKDLNKELKKDHDEKNWKGSIPLLCVTSTVGAFCLASGAYMAITNPMSERWNNMDFINYFA